MFRGPRCPVNEDVREWIEESLDLLTEKLGEERLCSEVILPDEDYFPDRYEGTRECVQQLLERVCGYLAVDPVRLRLAFYQQRDPFAKVRDASQGFAGGMIVLPTPGAKAESEPPHEAVVGIEVSNLDDPPGLVGTMVHEVCHLVLSDAGVMGDVANYELLTDLTTVFVGMGLLTANAAFRSGWTGPRSGLAWGRSGGWETRRSGYMSEEMYGYALAAWTLRRDEPEPDWTEYLSVNVRSYFQQSMRYFSEAGEREGKPKGNGGGWLRWLLGRRTGPSAEEHEHHALAYLRHDNYDLAIAELDAAIRLAPESYTAYYWRGAAWAGTGDHEAAIADFDRALYFNRRYPEALRGRASCCCELKRYDEALVEYDEAIRTKPNFAEAYLDRGRLLLTLGRRAEAKADFEQALRFTRDPELQDAAVELLGEASAHAVPKRPKPRGRHR